MVPKCAFFDPEPINSCSSLVNRALRGRVDRSWMATARMVEDSLPARFTGRNVRCPRWRPKSWCSTFVAWLPDICGMPPRTGSRSSRTMTSTAPSSKRHRRKPLRPLPRNRPNPVSTFPSTSVQEPASMFGKGARERGYFRAQFDVGIRYLNSILGARCLKGHHYQVLRPTGHEPD